MNIHSPHRPPPPPAAVKEAQVDRVLPKISLRQMWQDLVTAWTLHPAQAAKRKASASHREPGSRTSPWGWFHIQAELTELLTLWFRFPLTLAAGNWQKEERRHRVSPMLEGGSSGGCQHIGALRKCAQHMHTHTAGHETSGQFNLSAMVWRQDGDEQYRGRRMSTGWGGNVGNEGKGWK